MLALEEKEGFGDQCTEAIWPFPATAEKVMRGTARMRTAAFDSDSQSSHLRETLNFGSNPGALRMFTYIPHEIPAECGLVVVLLG